MIVDSHVHAWNRRTMGYAWMDDADLPTISSVPTRAEQDAAGTRTVILVEAGVDPAHRNAETESMLAQVGPAVAGVIAAADWRDGVMPAARSGLVGVRLNLLGAAVTGDAARRIAKAFSAATASDLAVDVLCSPDEYELLAHSLELADDVALVIDHLGRPPVELGWTSAAASPWLDSMKLFARHEGVRFKVSGPAAMAPDFVAAAIDLVGSDRCLLGSDWPMDRRGGYRDRVRGIVTSVDARMDQNLASATALSTYSLLV